MTITVGAWIVPLLITIISIWIAFAETDTRSGGYLAGIEILFYLPLAVIVSLVSWLIWALL